MVDAMKVMRSIYFAKLQGYVIFETKLYIEKLGYAGVYLFFLFLLQNIDNDCVYSLEPPRLGGSNVYSQSMF